MTTRGWGAWGRTVLTAAAVGAGLYGPPAEATAQGRERTRERPSTVECRCMDASGAEVQDCVCVRTPRMDRVAVAPFAPPGDRPRLGISVDVSDRGDDPRGARVAGVLNGGPADRAGLREGDVITRVNGRVLTDSLDAARERDLDPDGPLPAQRLLALARGVEPGDRVTVEFLRDGRTETATLEAEALSPWGPAFSFEFPEWDEERFSEGMRALQERMREFRGPEGGRLRIAPLGPGRSGTPGAPVAPTAPFGLELTPLNPGLGAYFGAERGVLVTAVEDGSALGLRAGDVILAVDGVPTERPEEVRALILERGRDRPVTFRVRREGREIDVSGRARS